MTNAEEVEEQELRETKYPKLRVLTGGKGPPEDNGPGVNWLSDLAKGTMFICRSNRKQTIRAWHH